MSASSTRSAEVKAQPGLTSTALPIQTSPPAKVPLSLPTDA